jgi:hypothetical protein
MSRAYVAVSRDAWGKSKTFILLRSYVQLWRHAALRSSCFDIYPEIWWLLKIRFPIFV